MLRRCAHTASHHEPRVQHDAEGQVESGEHEHSSEALQQQSHQADLEDEGVEQHQQNDDQVEQDGDVLDSVEGRIIKGQVRSGENWKFGVHYIVIINT